MLSAFILAKITNNADLAKTYSLTRATIEEAKPQNKLIITFSSPNGFQLQNLPTPADQVHLDDATAAYYKLFFNQLIGVLHRIRCIFVSNRAVPAIG
ncbi:hypothetical protein [Parapedobacter tibetensis]|uniref:hypothetical protein n=1 Tax=Parapedobacter tibetensis TaxID=2972951 RepID=UPI00214D4C21|nr:hypothetical protein [Parapedobacter tibetensis]